MPNLYIENEDKWRSLSDIDYFTQFVRVWIPFNAWYKNAYPTLKSDRACINEIKTTNNKITTKLLPYLANNDVDSNEFRNLIGRLHHELERKHIFNRGERITFTQIVIDINPVRIFNNSKNNFTYFVERGHGGGNSKAVLVTVSDRTNTQIFNLLQTEYDYNHLTTHPDFINNLSAPQKAYLQFGYNEINPLKQESLLEPAPADDRYGRPTNYKQCGNYKFKTDDAKLCKSLIEILYNLRNVLFHGQIVPDKDTGKVYEPAYHLLKMLI